MQHYDILSKLQSSFDNALKTGDLLFFPSTVERHTEADVEYQIRLCPALQNKPALPTPHFDQKEKVKFDPFAPPYNANLLVGELTDEESKEEFIILVIHLFWLFRLLLESVYSSCSLLVEQICCHPPPLFASDQRIQISVVSTDASRACPIVPASRRRPEARAQILWILQLQVSDRRMLDAPSTQISIHSGGDNSGASQSHKHIQFVPLDSGEDGPPIELLARRTRLEHQDRPFSLTQLPYASHTYRFPSHLPTSAPEHLESLLADAFLQLLDLTISTIRHDPDYPTGSPSYNVILTLEHLHLIPRKLENYVLPETGDKLSVNALGYAGMLLVKSAEEFEVVKRETVGKILRGVGLASVHELQVEGTAQEAPLAGL